MKITKKKKNQRPAKTFKVKLYFRLPCDFFCFFFFVGPRKNVWGQRVNQTRGHESLATSFSSTKSAGVVYCYCYCFFFIYIYIYINSEERKTYTFRIIYHQRVQNMHRQYSRNSTAHLIDGGDREDREFLGTSSDPIGIRLYIFTYLTWGNYRTKRSWTNGCIYR